MDISFSSTLIRGPKTQVHMAALMSVLVGLKGATENAGVENAIRSKM